MNKDQVKGRIKEAEGAVKEVAGKIVGNKTLQVKGGLEKLVGRVQSGFGDIKEEHKKTDQAQRDTEKSK